MSSTCVTTFGFVWLLSLAARTLTLGLVLLVVPFLPACNIFFRVGFVIAERVLYLSSAGYCLLLAYALGHCCCRWSKYRVRRNHADTIKQYEGGKQSLLWDKMTKTHPIIHLPLLPLLPPVAEGLFSWKCSWPTDPLSDWVVRVKIYGPSTALK